MIGYLRSWGMNIEIHLTASEYGRVEGLCGSFDGNSTNDLKVKGTDNYLLLPPTSVSLLDFVKSWRSVLKLVGLYLLICHTMA